MKTLLMAAAIAVNAFGAGAKAQKPAPASKETVKLVRYFLKTPTEALDAERIPEFMEIDADSLPLKLQAPYLGKKEELLMLKKISDSRKKPPVRLGGMDDDPPGSCLPDPPRYLGVLPMAGYETIKEEEEEYLMDKTKCTECDLITEFSLRKVEKTKNASGKKEFVYFLHSKDPLMTLVGAYRAGTKNPFGTNFFGLGYPTCH